MRWVITFSKICGCVLFPLDSYGGGLFKSEDSAWRDIRLVFYWSAGCCLLGVLQKNTEVLTKLVKLKASINSRQRSKPIQQHATETKGLPRGRWIAPRLTEWAGHIRSAKRLLKRWERNSTAKNQGISILLKETTGPSSAPETGVCRYTVTPNANDLEIRFFLSLTIRLWW